MKARELHALLARLTNRTPSDVDQRTRDLRAAGVINHGPRGKNAPDLTPVEAAYMLVCMASRMAPAAFEVAGRFATDCRYVQHPMHDDLVPYSTLHHGRHAIVVLAMLLEDETAFDVQSLDLADDGREAWLNIRNSAGLKHTLYFSCKADEVRQMATDLATYENQGAGRIVGRMSIGAGALAQIAINLRSKTESGWTDDVKEAAHAHG